MINREEIKQFVKANNLEEIIERVWGVNHTVEPKLLDGGPDGDPCRFGLAEHVIKTFFAAQTTEKSPNEVFAAFCERLHASEQDVNIALERTRRDFEDTEDADFAEQDVAVTLVWLWFVDAASKYGIYDVEMKFFLYSLADMSRGNPTLRRCGVEKLIKEAEEKPTLFGQLVGYVFGHKN